MLARRSSGGEPFAIVRVIIVVGSLLTVGARAPQQSDIHDAGADIADNAGAGAPGTPDFSAEDRGGNGPLSVRQTGAVGDCETDNWWAFQKAIDTVANRPRGGVVTVPPPYSANGCYRISQALRMRSLVTLRVLDDATRIRCTGDPGTTWHAGADPSGADVSHLGRWPTYSCVLFGAYESRTFTQLTPYPVAPVRSGDTSVVFSRSDASADFVAGDLISIETVSGYSVTVRSATYPVPTWRQVDLVTAADARSNAIEVQYPVQTPISSAQVLRLTNGVNASDWPTLNPVGGDTRIPLWATYRAAVLGGTWETPDAKLPFSTGSGTLDCRVAVHSITASRGVGYGNIMAGCHFHADYEVIAGVVSELSEGSHDNTVDVTRVEASPANGTGPTAFPRYVGVNESARNNRINVGTLNVGATEGTDAVQIWNATSNEFHVSRIEGSSVRGSIVSVASQHLPGNAPGAIGNIVRIDNVLALARGGRISIRGEADGNRLEVGGSN